MIRSFLAAALALLLAGPAAGDACRIAYDLGSSGVRAGWNGGDAEARADIDYLAPLWAGRGLGEVVEPTAAALRDLPAQGGFAAGCAGVGGGFSAWRLAARLDPADLVAALVRLRDAGGVPVLVIPQRQEGAYGYDGARRLLGERLRTSHVLDIGGGSLQIAGQASGWGEALGQKAWQRELCRRLRPGASLPCELQPLAADELATARVLLAEHLHGLAAALPRPLTLTAISRPVSRGVAPAVRRLIGGSGEELARADLSAAIARLAPLPAAEARRLTGAAPGHAAFLLSDMLLVEGLLQATGADRLQVAEADLTNVPGLLADERAYAWGKHYACYLERLVVLGVEAFGSDPGTCRW